MSNRFEYFKFDEFFNLISIIQMKNSSRRTSILLLILASLLFTITLQACEGEIPFCDQCKLTDLNGTLCKTCSAGYVLNQDQTLCQDQCPQLIELDPCTCAPTYVNQNGMCNVCFVDNCVLCSIDNTQFCDFCKSGYILQDDGTCKQECFQTKNFDTCACSPRQINKNGQCLTCQASNCLLCQFDNENICDICRDGFTNVNGVCKTCNLDFCDVCSANFKTCSKCFDGFILTNGACKIPTCSNQGQIFDGKSCVCPDGQYLSNKKKCVDCPSNCDVCGSGGCTTCLVGYYKNFVNSCLKCPNYCLKCTNANSCDVCKDGFNLKKQQCVSSSTGRGQSEFVSDTGEAITVICPGSCQQCSSPAYCEKCSKGFALEKGQCQLCNPQCLTCSPTDKNFCQTCYPKQILNNNRCFSCPINCITCTKKDFCKTCIKNYYSNQGKCTSCPEFCVECSSDSAGCIECEPGFTAVGTSCVPCLVGCNRCKSTDNSICESCDQGFYLNETIDKEGDLLSLCQICPKGCSSCASAKQCDECSPGYTLWDDNLCYPQCVFPCSTCVKNSPNSCKSCYGGYVLTKATSKCVPSTGCNSTSTCFACQQDYALISGKCYPCQYQFNNCSSCSSKNLQKCKSCDQGFYLTSSSCTKCPKGCKACETFSSCTECIDGYFAALSLKGEPLGQCLICDTSCLTCQKTATSCTSCNPKIYELQGDQCLYLDRVKVRVQLDFIYDDFMQRYQQLLRAYSKLIFASENHRRRIHPTKKKRGSVILDARIEPIEGVSLDQISNTLKDTTQIGDFSLVSAPNIQIVKQAPVDPVDPVDPTPTPTDPSEENGETTGASSNLGLILGLSIPLGILALLILFLVMKKTGESAPDKLGVQSTGRLTGIQDI